MKPTESPSPKKKLTQKYLKEILCYDPATGIFTWKISPRVWIYIGDVAGCIDKSNGYIKISIKNRRYHAHRLAFLYMDGYLPENEVDHINRNRSDNTWENLRHVSRLCNARNTGMLSSNTSGIKGVVRSPSEGKWIAQIQVMGECIYLGTFPSKVAAAKARWDAEKKHMFTDCNTNSSALEYLREEGAI